MTPSTIDILETLESDNSRLFKENLLREMKGDALLKRTFVAASDPYTNYFINKFKCPPPVEDTDSEDVTLKTFLDIIAERLATRQVTGNAAKALVVHMFSKMTAREQKWCQRILLRNLRVGVMESTINKTWPGAISKFSVQLAETLGSTFEKGKGIAVTDEVDFPVRVEPKLDGLRCIAVKHAGTVTMFTRSGSPIDTLPTIKAVLESAPWDDFVLDGETMGRDWNESASVVMSKKTAKDDSNMVYNVFDAMHFDDWKGQDNATATIDRVGLVSGLVATLPKGGPVVQVNGKTVQNMKELLKFYSETMALGYEGIMLKDLSSPYVFKRTEAVLKLKPVATFEGCIVSHYEGKRGSKREGLWGGFEVVFPNGEVTKVGGGYSDKLKAEIGIDPDSWIGKIVEVEGQPEPLTDDGYTVDGKIRFPVYIRERDPRDVDPKVTVAYKKFVKENGN